MAAIAAMSNIAPTLKIMSSATRFKLNRTKGHMSKTPLKVRCGACLRRRAKLRKFLQRFKKGSKK